MFVLCSFQFVFYICNEIGIFILLGVIGSESNEQNDSSMQIYSSLLTLFLGFDNLLID